MHKFKVYSRYKDEKYIFSIFDESETFYATCDEAGYDGALKLMEMIIMLCLRLQWRNEQNLELEEYIQDESDIEYELIKIRDE